MTETIVTFERTNTLWEGFGINSRTNDGATIANQVQGLNPFWTRFYLSIDDPGEDAIYYTNAAFDNIWRNSLNIKTQSTRYAYSSMGRTKFIFTCKTAPYSFVTKDGQNELRGDALVAYARLFASAIIVHRSYGMQVEWIELLDEPSILQFNKNFTYVTPENYVILVQTFKSILSARVSELITAGAPPSDHPTIKVMGPGLNCMFIKNQSVDPYISIFLGQNGIIDAWSIHVIENEKDSNYYNKGNYSARLYVLDQMKLTTSRMKWTLPELPIYVTKFSTNASRYSSGIDYGIPAPESVEFGIRLMDNACSIITAECSTILSWYLSYKHDHKTLYRDDGSKRWQKDALQLLNRNLPVNGNIYIQSSTSSVQDETLKAVVVSQNSYGFILSRGQMMDATGGKMKLRIPNTTWQGNGIFISTLSLYAYPNYMDVSGIEKTAQIINGELTVSLRDLPCNCVIYARGDIYNQPALSMPTLQYSPFNIPKVSDLNSLSGVIENDIVYHIQDKSIKIYKGGVWLRCQFYDI